MATHPQRKRDRMSAPKPRIKVTCPCGTEFDAHARKVRVGKGKYCTPECGYRFRPKPTHRGGRPIPPKQQRKCAQCGTDFEVSLSKVIHNGAGTFCSRPCQGDYLRGQMPSGFLDDSGQPRFRTHGAYQRPEYRSWKAMRSRCLNPNNAAWEHYGGRGITICAEWADFEVFMRDMGPRPEGLTLDRIDVNGNYEPSNCRWLPLPDQSRNRRPSSEWKKRSVA